MYVYIIYIFFFYNTFFIFIFMFLLQVHVYIVEYVEITQTIMSVIIWVLLEDKFYKIINIDFIIVIP